MDKFLGMIINLKKRMPCITSDDVNKSKFLMFEYYDGMDIICVDNWYDFRPGGVLERGGNVDISDDFIDKFTLKVYFPQASRRASLKDKGFNYSIWETIGRGKFDQISMDDKPFVSVVMVNLSREFIKKKKLLTEKFSDLLVEVSNEMGISLKKLNCAIMPSIGYSDFVMLFLCSDLTNVTRILDGLKGKICAPKSSQYHVISNSYAVSGLYQNAASSISDEMIKNLSLSVRFDLNNGIPAAYFEKLAREYVEKNEISISDASVYQVLGSSDSLMFINSDVNKVLGLFKNGGILNPGSKELGELARYTRSSLCVKSDGTGLKGVSSEQNFLCRDLDNYERVKKRFEQLIGSLKEMAHKYNLHMRPIIGLQGVMKTYLNLINFSHSFDVEIVIGSAFDALEENIRYVQQMLDDPSDKLSVEERNTYLENLIDAIKIFRDKIGDYLGDLQRSDRLFIEGQSLSHPSIGSATKLLFFFNCFINDAAKEFAATEIDSEDKPMIPGHTFVVTSGGCDYTVATDLFSFLDPFEARTKSLVFIEIPEMSLYDVRGTMFRLLHECIHFCGERQRLVRKDKLLESVAENCSIVLTQALQWELIGWGENTFASSLSAVTDDEKKEIIEDKLMEIVCDMAEATHNDIKNSVLKVFSNNMGKSISDISEMVKKDISKDYIYGRYIEQVIYKALQLGLYTESEVEMSEFMSDMVTIRLDLQKRCGERLKKELGDNYDINTSKADILIEVAENKMKRGKTVPGTDMYDYRILESFVLNYMYGIIVGNHIYPENGQMVAGESISFLQLVYKESLADCIAAETLKLDIADFLLCFVYEERNLDVVFSFESVNVMRIAADLKVLFGVDGELGDDHRKYILAKVQNFKKCGFDYDKKPGFIKALCDRIDGILQICESDVYKRQMKPLLEYLDVCRRTYIGRSMGELDDVMELVGVDYYDGLYQMLTMTRKQWKEMA